jgi:hypothetical protein
LRAVVGVNDCPVDIAATPDRHLQRVDDKLAAEVIGDRPADDATGERVEDDREADLAGVSRVLGDVTDPEPIGCVHGEAAVHEIV